jgi:predicted MFS family arabinose efflux permease
MRNGLVENRKNISASSESDEAPRAAAARAAPLSRGVILLLAFTCGLSVANVYFAHPLLDIIARDFRIAGSDAGVVVTVTQAGYALGLIFLVPLGDLIDQRRLIVGQATLSSLALVIAASANSVTVFLVAVAVVGLLAVVVQVVVAFAATLAAPEERGRVVGTVTSGVVIGILLARTVSGAMADLQGWRSVYFGSALLTLLMAAFLVRALPSSGKRSGGSYLELLRSMALMFAGERILRIRAVFALLIFAAFNVLWAPLSLFLSEPPFSLSHTGVGMLGLAGVAGAFGARRAGQWADKGFARHTTFGAIVLMLMAWSLMGVQPFHLWALIAGAIILNFAVQAVHVTNQTMIFAIRPEARSRLVGCYMTFYSIGSAAGAIASTSVFSHAGWSGVCELGFSIGVVALLVFLTTGKSEPSHR